MHREQRVGIPPFPLYLPPTFLEIPHPLSLPPNMDHLVSTFSTLESIQTCIICDVTLAKFHSARGPSFKFGEKLPNISVTCLSPAYPVIVQYFRFYFMWRSQDCYCVLIPRQEGSVSKLGMAMLLLYNLFPGGMWGLAMVLVGYGSNDFRLRVCERVDWMVFHFDHKNFHQRLVCNTPILWACVIWNWLL